MDTNESGKRLKELRDEAGLTQQKLASLSGVHEVNICKMETGKMPISGRSLLRLCRTLGKTLNRHIDPFDLSDETAEKIYQKN